MPSSTQYPALFCQKRMHVPGPHKVASRRFRIDRRDHGARTLFGRDSRFHTAMIDRGKEPGSQRGRVVLDDRHELQPLADVRQDRQAEFTATIHHQVDVGGSGLFRGADEIALVLPVLGVHDDHHLAAGHRIDGIRHAGELRFHKPLLQKPQDQTGLRPNPGIRSPLRSIAV